MAEVLQNIFEEYKHAVSKNSAFIARFESAFRLISYAVPGRFEDSTILSELLYSASKLLVLFNDAIIKKASGILPNVSTSQERLQSIITVLEYVSVFIELASHRLYGEVGRWIAIAVLQLAKTVCRFFLLVRHQMGIQPVPPITPIDRDAILEASAQTQTAANAEEAGSESVSQDQSHTSVTVKLKRSGKVMRTLATAPPLSMRDWKIPGSQSKPTLISQAGKGNLTPSVLSRRQMWGECLYLLKPVIHLTSMYVSGSSSFKPWLVSAGLDVGSLYLMDDNCILNVQEKAELRRRSLMLVMYMLRSPMYERYTKEKLLQILSAMSTTIPGLSLVLGPLMNYLPVWQQMYFYTWSV